MSTFHCDQSSFQRAADDVAEKTCMDLRRLRDNDGIVLHKVPMHWNE